MTADLRRRHGVERRQPQESGRQDERDPVRDRHGEEIGGGCERHRGGKKQQPDGVDKHRGVSWRHLPAALRPRP